MNERIVYLVSSMTWGALGYHVQPVRVFETRSAAEAWAISRYGEDHQIDVLPYEVTGA